MKKAHFIPITELAELIRNHLEANDHYVGVDTGISIASDGIVVHNAPLKSDITVGEATATLTVSEGVDSDEPNGFVAPEPTEAEEKREDIIAILTETPMTVEQVAYAACTTVDVANEVMSDLDLFKAAPARENGRTVSKWMIDGTPQATAFRIAEKARVNGRVEDMRKAILDAAPLFHQRRVDRPTIVSKMVEQCAHEDQAEGILRDARAVFYRMAETGELEHDGHTWRAGKTAADKINVASLQGAIREVLMQAGSGLSKDEIRAKLPAKVEGSFFRHSLRRMDDVYEQGGLLHHAA